jgi:hypothetical protein
MRDAEGVLKLLARVRDILEASSIPYALIGAGAMTVHGVGRSTLDLDLLTTEPRVLEEKVWASLKTSGASLDVRRGDPDDPLAGVVRFEQAEEPPVDLVVGRSRWQAAVLERARRMSIGEFDVPVVGAADLILLKLFAGGAQDAWDIEELLATGDRAVLSREVESRIGDLPADVLGLWSRIRGDEKR